MKHLVTGGAGFIGSHIVDRLLKEGHEVIVIDNESADSNEQFYWNKLASNHKLDITDYENIKELFKGVHTVFHLAAESRIQPAINNPLHAARVNFLGTCTILQCAREENCHSVVYSSTSASYGLKNKIPLQESMNRDCLNPYSVTKCAGEDLCRMYFNLFGLKTVTLRYFNVYGPRQPLRGEYAPVIGLFLRQSQNNTPMTVVGDGEQKRDFTHIDDIVNANISAMKTQNPEAFGEIFNIGSGKQYSINDITAIIGTGFVYIDERLGEARDSLADITKATKILNHSPTRNLKDWLLEELERQ